MLLVLLLWWAPPPSLTCNSLAPAPVLPIYNQTCSWTSTPEVCLSSVSSDQLEPSAPPWPALASRRLTNCHCYQENCHYFSFRDAIKLSWHSASQFCACLGGSLARQEGDSSSALSYYTLGLVAGTGSQSGQPSRESDRINNCQNYLQCLQNYQVRDHSQGMIFSQSCSPTVSEEYGECGQQILWLDQLTADDKCGALAAWEGLKHWLPCKQKVNFVCVPSSSASLNKTFSYLLVWILYRWIIFP